MALRIARLAAYPGVALVALAMAASAAAQTTTADTSSASASASQDSATPSVKPGSATKQPSAGKSPSDGTATPASQSQATPSDKTAAQDGETTTITITAQKPEVEHKIDRDVYDVKQDPQAATGVAADVLNNIPAVTVDSDGTVTLRGNSSVQVYVNGKKSTQMQGDNRAFTLQSLSADDIDTIEVMTNPSAAFGADTSGGIINIVMKRGRTIKPQTSINATVGDQGRANIGLRSGKTWGKFTLNGSLNFNHGAGGAGGSGQSRGGGGGGRGGSGPKTSSITDRITLDPTTGETTREDVTYGVAKSDNRSASLSLNGTYNFNDNDSLEGILDYRKTDSTGTSSRETKSYDGAHTLTQDYGSLGNSSRDSGNLTFGLTYDHRGPVGTTEDFKMAFQHSESLSQSDSTTQNIYHQSDTEVVAPETWSAQYRKSKDVIDEFSGDWSHPVGKSDKVQSQVQLGWDIQSTISDQFSYQSQTLAEPVVPPASPRNNGVTQFNDNELLSAVYATWQQQRGKYGYQIGLRVENLHQDIETQNLVPSDHPDTPDPATQVKRDSLVYSPSLFLTYNLTSIDHLKFIYSQKVKRPSASQINPMIVYSDDLQSASSGNANLRQETTDKYELDYYRDVKGGTLSGSIYHNDTRNFINSVQTYIDSPSEGGTPVLLSTYENSGSSRQTGVSVTYGNAFFGQKLRIMLSGDYSRTSTDGFDYVTHTPLHTDEPSSSARAMFRYAPNKVDSYVLNLQYSGRRGDTQGYTTPSQVANLSYTHQIIPSKMVLTANASNFIFGPLSKRVNQTSVTRGYSQTFNPGASFTLSLRYTFGAVRQSRGEGDFRGPPDGSRGGPPGGGPGGGFGPGG